MFSVKTPDEVVDMIYTRFGNADLKSERADLVNACGRILAQDIVADTYVPDFDRSTVDGFAVRASSTFGCSDSMPTLMRVSGRVAMGTRPDEPLEPGCCVSVPTGGAVPEGADAVVMLEHTEDYGRGEIGVCRAAAPGENIIFRGDDVFPGKTVLRAGRMLNPADIGALAAMGYEHAPVYKKPTAGIISTGDELVSAKAVPGGGQVRDVNSSMLAAALSSYGAVPVQYGIIRDDAELLRGAVSRAVRECDIVLISGGSSVGTMDATRRVLEESGEILFHGIAMKPGKPAMLAKVAGKPVFGLPGHPVAAYFGAELFVSYTIGVLMGRELTSHSVRAYLSEPVSANDGRALYMGVFLEKRDGVLIAVPARGKSGLITRLAGCDGFLCVPRDCEGFSGGTEVTVTLYGIH